MFKSRSRMKTSTIILAFAMLYSLVLVIPGFGADDESGVPYQNGPTPLSLGVTEEDDEDSENEPNAEGGEKEIDIEGGEEDFDTSGPDLNLFDPTLPFGDMSIEPFGLGDFMPFATTSSGYSSDLADFLDRIVMTDSNGQVIYDSDSSPTGLPTFIGQVYTFTMYFSETSQLQMQYAPPPAPFPPPSPNPAPTETLTYQLPAGLTIQNEIAQTPIYATGSSGSFILGWYTIDANGLVQVWFNDVDLNGNPTPDGTNFIDFYANVELTLNINAQLQAGDGNLDFGGGVQVVIPVPITPDPTLNMVKSSRYDPINQIVYYMITISVAGGSATNITLDDTPSVGAGDPITEDGTTPYPGTAAFSEPLYTVYRVGAPLDRPNTFNITWTPPPGPNYDGAEFSYDFGSGFVLNEGDLITITYHVSLPQLITNNNETVPSLASNTNQPLVDNNLTTYAFTLNNSATVNGDDANGPDSLDPVTDTTEDPVKREVTLQKNGQWVSGDDNIQWSITVGDGISMPLNGGVITDLHGQGILLPANTAINVQFYNSAGAVFFSGTAADFPTAAGGSFVRTDATGLAPGDSGFIFTLPPVNSTLNPPMQAIYKVVITYMTPIVDIPQTGEPAIIYTNDVNFTLPDGSPGPGTTGQVPVFADDVTVKKTTSGICGTPDVPAVVDGTPAPNDEPYYVNYTTTFDIPGGLQGQPIYIYDNLGFFGTGDVVTNVPENLVVTAVGQTAAEVPIDETPANTGALYFYDNAWTMYFGPTNPVAPNGSWPYDGPVTLTVSYTIFIDAATLSKLQATNGSRIMNSIYLINSDGNPNIAHFGNSVGSSNASDYWPIFKSAVATANPSLFDYTVVIKGNYSNRTDPLLPPLPKVPIYTDTFDTRLEYVSGTFYIENTDTLRYYVPVPDVNYATPGTIIADLTASWQEYSGSPTGALIDPNPENWYSVNQTLVAHYQLRLIDLADGAQTLMNNTAQILVNDGECAFQSNATVNYEPEQLSKTMTPTVTGSDRVEVSIIINPDGSVMFNDGSSPAPLEITAKDYLTNLQVFSSTIIIWTQTFTNGYWDGVWKQVGPTSFNDNLLWSANIIPAADVPAGYDGEVDFVIPNGQPVKITYDALVTLPPGQAGDISNEIWIFGQSDEDIGQNYVVGGSGIGAGAGMQPVTVFKRDSGGANLSGAVFELLVTDPSSGYIPPVGVPIIKTLTGANGQVMNFGRLPTGSADSLTTDANGIVTFNNKWIESSDKLLYLLVEVSAPPGYTAPNFYSFFTISRKFTATELTNLADVVYPLAAPFGLNQISDFIEVVNIYAEMQPGSLRIIKKFDGLTDAQALQYLRNFYITVTVPDTGDVYQFSLYNALNPFGIVIPGLDEGILLINEFNTNAPGYTWSFTMTDSGGRTHDTLPTMYIFMPNPDNEIVINLTNHYKRIPSVAAGTNAPTGDPFDLTKYLILSFIGLIGIAAILGRVIYPRIRQRL